ncbi:MAG: hypothetical protein QW327_02725 [Candidatus Odinarchaeota archaeon]
MVKISYSKKLSTEELTDLIREIALLAEKKHGTVTIDGIPVPITLAKMVDLDLELEVGKDENELELELKWSKTGSIEAEKATIKAIKELSETSGVELGSNEVRVEAEKTPEPISHVTEPLSEEKTVLPEQAPLEEKAEADIEKRMEAVLQALTSEKEGETTGGGEIDFKPQGNLLKIAEKETGEQAESSKISSLEEKMPEYTSLTESSVAQIVEKLEVTPEKTENKTEKTDELDSTEELEKILKALKESRLSEHDKEAQ